MENNLTINNTGNNFSHIKLSYITTFYFNQNDNSTLTDLLRKYTSYSPAILDYIQFIFIDDASPSQISIPEDINLNILLIRINHDIPWNQPGARNLGMVYARSDKVIITDIDHEMTEHSLLTMINHKNPGRTIYKMKRVDSELKPCKPHPNTFLMSRSRFLRLHGYDEEFCGHYGFDDAMFWRWQRYHGTRFLYLPKDCYTIVRQSNKVKDHSLKRDLDHNRGIAERKRQEWKKYGPNAGHSRQFLNFTWTTKMDRIRKTHLPPPAINKSWTSTWIFRWLMPAK